MHRQYHPQPQPATRRWQVLRTLAAHVAGAAEPSPGGAAPAPFPSPPEPVPALAAAMTNTEIKRRFAADGFIHLRGFFSPGEVAPRQVVEAQRHDHCHDHCVPELERSDRTANAQVAQMERELRRFIDAVLPESAVGRSVIARITIHCCSIPTHGTTHVGIAGEPTTRGQMKSAGNGDVFSPQLLHHLTS